MAEPSPTLANRIEVHDAGALAAARAVLDACADARGMAEAVQAAVARNATWRGEQCINLLAPGGAYQPRGSGAAGERDRHPRGGGPYRAGQSLVRRHPPHRRA